MAPARRQSAAKVAASPRRSSTRAASKQAKAQEEAVAISDDDDGVVEASPNANGKRKSAAKSHTNEAEGSPKSPMKKGKGNGAARQESSNQSSPAKSKKTKVSNDQANGKVDVEAAVSLSAPPPGGAKMDTLAPEDLPKNASIPDPLQLSNTPKPKDVTRITSWNILSLKSSLGKGLIRYLEAEAADVVIMTETKCNEVPMHPKLKEMYPHQTWGIGKTKGYAGIAMLSKNKPIKVTTGLPGSEADTKGRIITAEFEKYHVIGTYVVNAGEGLKTLEAKKAWQRAFAAHLAACDKIKPVIWGGDLNVVLDARDLSNASKKWNKSAGYTQAECDYHRETLAGTAIDGAQPFVDIWRERHPDAVGHYSYYGFRGQCRQKGIGWRLDTFIVPKRVADQVQDVEIRQEVYGASDHVPVYIDIKGAL